MKEQQNEGQNPNLVGPRLRPRQPFAALAAPPKGREQQPSVTEKAARWSVSRVLSSIKRDDHSSWPALARLAHATNPDDEPENRPYAIPIRSCSGRGLPCLRHYCPSGALLPHLFTLTPLRERYIFCGAFPRITPAGRYPASCFHGARTFLTFPCEKARSPDHLTIGQSAFWAGSGQVRSGPV